MKQEGAMIITTLVRLSIADKSQDKNAMKHLSSKLAHH